jgi:hypothetical protein
MFRVLLCPSSGARQTTVAASGFRLNMEVDVFSTVVGLLVINKPTTAENISTSSHYAHHKELVKLSLQPLVSV